MEIVWIVRLLLLAALLPLLVPFAAIAQGFVCTPIAIALLALAFALLALAFVLGLILGVLGTLVDVLIVSLLVGLAWKWPRGIQAPLPAKIRLAYRGLRNVLRRQLRHGSTTDFALCLAVVIIATILSLSSGLLHFVLTVCVVLLVVGVVWKWPRTPHLPVLRKLHVALRALWDDLRSRVR